MNLKIKKANLIILIALLVYLKPANAVLWPHVNNIYQVAKVLITLVIIAMFVKNRIKLERSSVLCLSFIALWGISIYLNNGGLGDNLQALLSIIGLMLLFCWASYSEKRIQTLFATITIIAKTYIILELITIILDKPLFSEAIVSYDKYFLGSDNYSAFIILPLTGIMVSHSYLKKGKITASAWIFAILGFLDLALPFAVTGMIAYLLMMIAFALISYPNIRRLFTIHKVAIFIVLFLVAVIFFGIQNHMQGLLGMFGKTGLTSREIIWPKAVQAIISKPIIGWGSLSEEQVKSYILYGAGHAHNIVLEFLLCSGIAGTLLFYIWVKRLVEKTIKIRTNYIYSMQVCIACYLLCGLFDFYLSLIYFWLMLFSFDLYGKFYKLTYLGQGE